MYNSIIFTQTKACKALIKTMTNSKLENLGFYATEEITDYEWLTIQYPLHYKFFTRYAAKDNSFQLFGYTIN